MLHTNKPQQQTHTYTCLLRDLGEVILGHMVKVKVTRWSTFVWFDNAWPGEYAYQYINSVDLPRVDKKVGLGTEAHKVGQTGRQTDIETDRWHVLNNMHTIIPFEGVKQQHQTNYSLHRILQTVLSTFNV